MIIHTIGDRVRYLRAQLGMSMEVFSKVIDSTSASISNIENNKSTPGGEILIKISNVCKVSTDWILKGSTSEDIYERGTILYSPNWQLNFQINEVNLTGEELYRYQAVHNLVESIKEINSDDIILIAQLASKITKSQ